MREEKITFGIGLSIFLILFCCFYSTSDLIKYSLNKDDYTVTSAVITRAYIPGYHSKSRNTQRVSSEVQYTENDKIVTVEDVKTSLWEGSGTRIELAIPEDGDPIRTCPTFHLKSILFIVGSFIYLCYIISRIVLKKTLE